MTYKLNKVARFEMIDDGWIREGISFFFGRFEDLKKEAGVLLSDDLVDLSESQFG